MSMFGFLTKREFTAQLAPSGAALRVKGGERLLTAALAAGLDWPHDCRVGSCGTCRCVLKSGRIKPLTDFSYTLSQEEIRAGVILACQSALKSDVVVEVELGRAELAPESVAGTISATRHLTHDIIEVTVALESTAFLGAKAGQYVDIACAMGAVRSYSFARAPDLGNGRQATFFIRHVPGGVFTDWLFADDRRGAALTLRGPFGSFHLREASGRMICVAGGSGLAPIYALLESAAASGIRRDCVVLFGARTVRDLYFLDELATLGRQWAGAFEVIAVLSEEPGSDWRGPRGLVTEQLAVVVGAGCQSGDQGYLCGPPAMVDAGITALRQLGMRDDAIFFDKFLDASTQPGGRAAVMTVYKSKT